MTYDPNDPNDPLRHNFLKRKKYSDFALPIEVKVANGLGVDPPSAVQRVALRARRRLGLS